MKKLLEWTLETIRESGSDFSWMEESRFDWTPLVKSAVTKMVKGETLLILTDSKRKWFSKYALNAINSIDKGRPFFPVYDLNSCFPSLQEIGRSEDIDLLEDMLGISFPDGYSIWYIGTGKHPYTKLAYRSPDNFLWVIDDEVPDSFLLRGSDPLLDIKLLQLYKLFDKTIEAILYGDIDIDA